MIGLTGNDTYIVIGHGDEVVEQVAEGTDTIRTFVTRTLPIYVENLVLEGRRGINGVGNNLPNRIIGNTRGNGLSGGSGNDILQGRGGSDTLDGGPGNDILKGGEGGDTFRFSTALNASTNVDRVTDFAVGIDSLELLYTVFPAFILCDYDASPRLSRSRLHIGASATTEAHRIIYHPKSGDLDYDSDGSGPIAAVRFAKLSPDLALTGDDFYIFSRLCP